MTGWRGNVMYQRCVPARYARQFFPGIRPGWMMANADRSLVVTARMVQPSDFDDRGHFGGDIGGNPRGW